MFLSFALYEILDSSGRMESFHIRPNEFDSYLTTDWLEDVSKLESSRDVDLGPLRFYTGEHGLKVNRTASKLSDYSFRTHGDNIQFTESLIDK